MMVLLSIIFFWNLSLCAWFEHGRAVDAAQKGNWEHAHALLMRELVNSPDDPSVVYDAGVAAYKIGDYEQASACFNYVTSASNAADSLKERAYFNAGNSCVALKKLEDAIVRYEQALRICPQDERARHNLDIVKKMLEEQKQQQEHDKKEEQSEQQKNEKEQQEQSDKQSESEGDSESENQQEKDNKQSDIKNSDARKKEDEQKKEDARKEQGKQKEDTQHAQGAKKDAQEHKKDALASAKAELAQKLDKQFVYLLEQQEKHDADINKQMIKATVGSQMGDKHDKQCW